MPIQERALGKWGKRGQLLSILLVWSAVIYGITLYSSGAARDRNLAYTAMFMDDLAVDIYRNNGSFDAVVYTSGMANKFCELYDLETRTLERDRYTPLCEAIRNRLTLLMFCSDDEFGCTEEQIQRLENMLEVAEPIAKDLKENPPYYEHVLSYDPTQFVTQNGEPITMIPG